MNVQVITCKHLNNSFKCLRNSYLTLYLDEYLGELYKSFDYFKNSITKNTELKKI